MDKIIKEIFRSVRYRGKEFRKIECSYLLMWKFRVEIFKRLVV